MKVILVSSFLFGVAWATLTCDCGIRNAGRIVGGNITKKNEYPWMVALTNTTTNFTYCGGSVVTPWHVLTAAHCVNYSKTEFFFTVGAYDVNDFSDSSRQVLHADKIIIHPQYEPIALVNDIAVLVPTTKIIYNEVVGPVCMPNRLLLSDVMGQMVKVMGWGRYDWRQPNLDKIKKLREVDLQIMKCYFISDPSKLCAYDTSKATCKGDSGGPLAWLDPETNRFTIVGVVSYGPRECGETPWHGVNNNVLYYLDWIHQQIQSTVSSALTCHKV